MGQVLSTGPRGERRQSDQVPNLRVQPRALLYGVSVLLKKGVPYRAPREAQGHVRLQCPQRETAAGANQGD